MFGLYPTTANKTTPADAEQTSDIDKNNASETECVEGGLLPQPTVFTSIMISLTISTRNRNHSVATISPISLSLASRHMQKLLILFTISLQYPRRTESAPQNHARKPSLTASSKRVLVSVW